MPPLRSFRLLPAVAALAPSVWIATGATADPRDAAGLISHVSERVAAYYERSDQIEFRPKKKGRV